MTAADSGRQLFAAVLGPFVLAIASAESRVLVQSPYFVPDQGVMDSLVSQSLAGVDVRLMMTGIPDKKLPWWAALMEEEAAAASSSRAEPLKVGRQAWRGRPGPPGKSGKLRVR